MWADWQARILTTNDTVIIVKTQNRAERASLGPERTIRDHKKTTKNKRFQALDAESRLLIQSVHNSL
jgi:hypothetical protein